MSFTTQFFDARSVPISNTPARSPPPRSSLQLEGGLRGSCSTSWRSLLQRSSTQLGGRQGSSSASWRSLPRSALQLEKGHRHHLLPTHSTSSSDVAFGGLEEHQRGRALFHKQHPTTNDWVKQYRRELQCKKNDDAAKLRRLTGIHLKQRQQDDSLLKQCQQNNDRLQQCIVQYDTQHQQHQQLIEQLRRSRDQSIQDIGRLKHRAKQSSHVGGFLLLLLLLLFGAFCSIPAPSPFQTLALSRSHAHNEINNEINNETNNEID